MPTLAREQKLYRQGFRLVAGVDEVGRGSLAGPVMAAAVILPQKLRAPWLEHVRDSKLLEPARREYLFPFITMNAISVGIGAVSNEVIDKVGIARATRLAMKSAIEQLSPPPDFVLIDYFQVPEITLPQHGVPEGDTLCMSIACASIIAKVTRDRLMVELDKTHPGYGLAQHKGYATVEHLACLRHLGPSPIHRRSFSPVGELML